MKDSIKSLVESKLEAEGIAGEVYVYTGDGVSEVIIGLKYSKDRRFECRYRARKPNSELYANTFVGTVVNAIRKQS